MGSVAEGLVLRQSASAVIVLLSDLQLDSKINVKVLFGAFVSDIRSFHVLFLFLSLRNLILLAVSHLKP